jgi:predicted ABC-type sugar transport system permease subunit
MTGMSPMGSAPLGARIARSEAVRYILPLLVAIIAISLYTNNKNARFLTFDNYQSIVLQVAVLGIIAIGQTFLIANGQLDLSAGALAALAGVIGAPLSVIEPAMAESLGSIVFVVVVIGGVGSLGGALAASLLIGCVQTLAVASDVSLGDVLATFDASLPREWDALTLAQLAPLIPYLLLVGMLALRPRGLFGRRDDHA